MNQRFGGWDEGATRAALLKTALAFLAAQLVYWLVISPFVFAPPPPLPGGIELSAPLYARLASPDPAGLAKVQFKPEEMPIADCCDPGYRAVRLTFDLPAGSPLLGIMPRIGADNYRMRVNGSTLYAEGRMVLPGATYHGNVRRVFRIPEAVLRPGANTLEFIMVRDDGAPFFFFGGATIAPYEPLAAAFASRAFTLNDYLTMSLAIGAVMAILLFVVWVRGNYHWVLFWMLAVVLGWTLRLLYFYLTDPPVHGIARMFFLFACVGFVPVAWLNLANHWIGQPWKWIGRVSLGAYAALLAAIGAIFVFGLWDKVDTVDVVTQWFVLAVVIAAAGLFVWRVIRNPDASYWETAIFGLCLSLMAWDAIGAVAGFESDQHSNRAMPFLTLGIVAAYLARNIRLFQSSHQLTTLLEGQLVERTAALEAAYLREKEMVRDQAHGQERQRIMRDMHDGLGSQLMSMLLMAKRGRAEPPAIADGLQAVIDEMRLMIDSMDSVGESLSSALTIFRERTQARVEGAGFAFHWNNTAEHLPDYGPRDVLQIFRILQEAVVNALKHSGGDRIAVRIAPASDPAFALRIEVADNGAGMKGANARGRGLVNMAARAESLGGALALDDKGGTRVTLDLPERSLRPA
ncbi:MAG: sensor histidine kinase [Sphingomonas sp.]